MSGLPTDGLLSYLHIYILYNSGSKSSNIKSSVSMESLVSLSDVELADEEEEILRVQAQLGGRYVEEFDGGGGERGGGEREGEGGERGGGGGVRDGEGVERGGEGGERGEERGNRRMPRQVSALL